MTTRKDPADTTPALGALDTLELRDAGRPGAARRGPAQAPADRPSSRAARAQAGHGWIWWLLGALLLGALLSLYVWREPLSARLVPETRSNQLMDEAAAALAAGRLSDPAGRGARELYGAVLALDQDHGAARAGLAQVGAAALQRARDALQRGDYPTARDALALARSLALPAVEIDTLDAQLQQAQRVEGELAPLLDAAQAARRDGRYEGSAGALALYARALQVAPDNALARAGRTDALADLLAQARNKLAADQVNSAQTLIDEVAAIDPGHLGLPAARAALGEHQQRAERSQRAQLDDAAAALRGGDLDAAEAGYRAALATQPDDATRGLRKIAAAYALQAETLAADFEFDAARERLQRARLLAPDSAAVVHAEQRLLRARVAREGAGELSEPSPDDQAARSDQVATLLAQARAAEANGDLLDPPGDSAYDKLRAAAAIAPDDPVVRRALAQFGPNAAACFERELTDNRLGRAEACLDALIAVEPGDPRIEPQRRRLAARWVALAEERLGAGELAAAARALDAARRLDPGNPGLPAARARLEQAQAGGVH